MIWIQMRASLTGKSSWYIWDPKDVERKTFVKDYPQGRMTSRSERRHSWDAPELLGGVSWIELGALHPSPGLLMPIGQRFLIFWAGWPLSFGFGEASPWAGRQGAALSFLLWLPLEVSVEGDMCTHVRTTHTPRCKRWIFQSVYKLCIPWYEKMKYCSVQIWVWWEGFRTFQINAASVTCNSTLPDCLQIIDLNLYSVHVQDKPDSFQSKLFFTSLAKIVNHKK